MMACRKCPQVALTHSANADQKASRSCSYFVTSSGWSWHGCTVFQKDCLGILAYKNPNMTLQKRKNCASNNQTWTLQQHQAKPTLCNPTNYLSANPPNCLRHIIQGLISKVHLRGLRARQVDTTRERLDALWRSSFQATPTKKQHDYA